MSVHHSQLDRYRYFVERKLMAWRRSLAPDAVQGRRIGPRVFVNSIPKSGTNLARSLLEHLPLLRPVGYRTLRDWNELSPGARRRIASLKRGQYALAHMPAHEPLRALLRDHAIRSLFIVRDPRDVVLSLTRYVTSMNKAHRVHDYFVALPSEEARLRATIHGVPGIIASLSELLDRYLPWLDEPGVLTIHFEDLVGPAGGGSEEAQQQAVAAIVDHLQMRIAPEQQHRIAQQVFSPTAPTFRKGQARGWKTTLPPAILAELEAEAGAQVQRLGYALHADAAASPTASPLAE
ncbi:MAG: sulfotransferase domain-containing protein [Bacteroidota bacterium]